MGILRMFGGIYNKAVSQMQNNSPPQNTSPIYTNQQPYMRQFTNAIQYDSRTLGIDVQADIERLKNFFRGRRLSADGKKYVKFEGSQEIVNEAGAELLLAIHESKLTIANATTNISDVNQIKSLCEEYGGNILELCLTNDINWQLDLRFCDVIIDELSNNFQLFLQKSLHNEQRKLMHGLNEAPQQPMNPLGMPQGQPMPY